MNKITLKDNRKIETETKKTVNLNPLTLDVYTHTNEDIYITDYFFDKDKNLKFHTKEKINNSNDEKKFMLTPSLLIPSSELLKIYDVDDINKFIKNNIDDDNFISMNRVLNSWIRVNFNDLKKNNNILINIYYQLLNNSFDIDKKIFNKECKIFLNKWFKNKNSDIFFMNLGNDLEKYLSNKYDQKI